MTHQKDGRLPVLFCVEMAAYSGCVGKKYIAKHKKDSHRLGAVSQTGVSPYATDFLSIAQHTCRKPQDQPVGKMLWGAIQSLALM